MRLVCSVGAGERLRSPGISKYASAGHACPGPAVVLVGEFLVNRRLAAWERGRGRVLLANDSWRGKMNGARSAGTIER